MKKKWILIKIRDTQMKSILILILIVSIFNGCSSGKFSVQEGDIRFKIPFDFPYPEKDKTEYERQKKMTQELNKLEGIQK